MNVSELFNIEGKNAIVTGGGRGLCRAMAEALHEAGARVLIIGRDEDTLARAAREMGAEGAPAGPGREARSRNSLPYFRGEWNKGNLKF